MHISKCFSHSCYTGW